jgi:hypothetical protein
MSRFRIFDLNPEQLQAVEHKEGPRLPEITLRQV